MTTFHPDPKPAARHVASKAEWENICREKAGPCRVCGSLSLIELHHLVNRSQQGDDIAENLVCLCRECHGKVTRREHDACHAVRETLLPEEVVYCVDKKSWVWLDERYPEGGGQTLCARCRRPVKLQEARSAPRKRKRYVVVVPADAEDGADVLDGLVAAHRERLKEMLGWQDDVPAYYVLTAVLAEAL